MELENLNKYHTINWELISKAINYYKGIGYKYIEVPWLVSEEAMLVTFSGDYLKGSFPNIKHKGLVGSAEQSFIQLMLDNKLNPGNYCTATPCFRFSETEDELHQKYFFKVELIRVLTDRLFFEPDAGDQLKECFYDAWKFFRNCLELEIEKKYIDDLNSPDAIDIMLNGVEIGSYGYRRYKKGDYGHKDYRHFAWIYGTGIAEPRLSIAIEKGK